MDALKSKGALLPASRNEIVDSLATIIMLHTTHPSSRELEKVAIKLIKMHPNTADKVPGGTAYVSDLYIIVLCNTILFTPKQPTPYPKSNRNYQLVLGPLLHFCLFSPKASWKKKFT